MKRSSDLEVDVIRMASNLPQDTVVIIGKAGTMKLHSVLRGKAEITEGIMKEAQELFTIFDHDPEDDK